MAEKTVDKKTIGITKVNERVLLALEAEGLFASEIEAAKFAMARAIDAGVQRGTTDGAGTKWNVGSVDSDGALKAVVEALYPDETQPYRLVEHLMNEGLRLFDKGDALPPDVAGVLFEINAERGER